jgi:RHS repeat-associated protein
MTYDALDRLATVNHATWGYAAYQYDPLGNRTWSPIRDISMRFEYDERNRLAWASQELLPTSMTFQWDEANRMVWSSDGASYKYDGQDRRVEKTDAEGTTVYHYDPTGRLVAETLPDGTKLRDYLYLGTKLVAVDGCMEGTSASGCAERQWYHTDTLGSVLARTDGIGAVVTRFDYRPWGEVATASGVAGDRQYNGRVFDPGTGFHDYGARLYWPEIGRFVSADSYQGDVANPASLSRYSYVQNNPYKFNDPDGHQARPPLRRGGGPPQRSYEEIWRAERLERAMERIEAATGRRPATIGPREEAPRWEFVRQMERVADAVDPRPVIDPRTGEQVGRFVVDPNGNIMLEPIGGGTRAAGPGGRDTHTTYPYRSNYQRLNPEGHASNPTPHGHGHARGTGPGQKGQGPSLASDGRQVPSTSPEAHWPVEKK